MIKRLEHDGGSWEGKGGECIWERGRMLGEREEE